MSPPSGSHAHQVLQDGPGEGRPFLGIGARPHLVDREPGTPPSASLTISFRFARWAEKVERLSAMDCSSPISAKTLVKRGIRRSFPTGGITPALGQGRDEAQRLQEDTLPPGVRPGNDQGPFPRLQAEVEGNHLFGPFGEKEGMPAVDDLQLLGPGGRRVGAAPSQARAARARA